MSFLHRHKLIFGIIIAIGILGYAAFNVWVYQVSKNGKARYQTVPGKGPSVLKGDSLPFEAQGKPQGDTFTESPTPTPRPTGPGQYACDEYGICNTYEDSKRVGCPKTYADPHCLNECENKDVRCTK